MKRQRNSLIIAALGIAGLIGLWEMRADAENTTGSAGEAQIEETAMIDRIAEFAAAGPNGAALNLAEVTDFDWDQVYGFSATMPPEMLEQALGAAYRPELAKLRESWYEDDALLVFTRDDEIVEQVAFTSEPRLVGTDARAYGTDAALVVHTKDPGPYVSVRLVAQPPEPMAGQ
ncbi:hypothetical protein [Paracoccus sediminicola]|uniref:hypothetical protein n=1 Tax=Paracoccus sediminicola TaxID=3017783 RepID=UPI0022F007EC|nr:hypothetical protein [Paracoccus sediminicola]WBU57173.1 hypothetical protein PAF18_01630 [Paracoccus sediminicola]